MHKVTLKHIIKVKWYQIMWNILPVHFITIMKTVHTLFCKKSVNFGIHFLSYNPTGEMHNKMTLEWTNKQFTTAIYILFCYSHNILYLYNNKKKQSSRSALLPLVTCRWSDNQFHNRYCHWTIMMQAHIKWYLNHLISSLFMAIFMMVSKKCTQRELLTNLHSTNIPTSLYLPKNCEKNTAIWYWHWRWLTHHMVDSPIMAAPGRLLQR